jgi:polyisoprenoid-binding protein YceI
MKKSILIFALLCLSFLDLSAQKKLTLNKAASKATYYMKHPMHDWDGTSKDINAVLVYNPTSKTFSQVAVVIKISSFDSGNSNRDSHMVEVLESIKFPTVSFSGTSIVREDNKITAKGNLFFHGVTKPLTLVGTISETDKKINIKSDFSVLLTDFNITKPTLMGVSTENEIKLKIDLSFNL